MTRINVGIAPRELPDKLLLAEHREITRIPNAVYEGTADLTQPIPERFKLGVGHVRFFYDKLLYLNRRYAALYFECVRRGFDVANKLSAFNRLDPSHLQDANDYTPTQRDRDLIINRIESKGFSLLPLSQETEPMAKKVATKSTTTRTATKKKAVKKKAVTTKRATTPRKKTTRKKTANKQTPTVSVEAKLFAGDNPLTADIAKELLGWTVVDKKATDYLLKDEYGDKIVCKNNESNRPLDVGNLANLKQEILRRKWKLNGVNRIIGKEGQVLNGQHTLIAVVLAAQSYAIAPDDYEFWDCEPYIETFVAYGIDEDDDTVNTLDTGKSRTLADVIYRSPYFRDFAPKDRKKVSRVADYAVRTVWQRTGAANAFAPRRTHSESLEFIDTHPELLRAIKHVSEELVDNMVAPVLPPGYSAGLCYLMGCCTSDLETYKETPSDSALTFDEQDKAEDFWTMLINGDKKLSAVRHLLGKYSEETGATLAERMGVVIKAWDLFRRGKKITEALISLEYTTDEDGDKVLAEFPTLGGIDVGKEDVEKPSAEERKEQQERAKAERRKKAAAERKAKGTHVNDPDPDNEGEPVTVGEGDTAWAGHLVDIYMTKDGSKIGKVRVDNGYAGAGKVHEVPMDTVKTRKETD